ncbi:ABC transporter ATP-binding protein [Homoserinimonas sp. OAct 916]|uniref:dipeptide ABC transporter ATP-binding protein n=1 Tax=Homoserinimonas sp. OAct 916 TaxID=2211450 RepID=UPI000DBE7E68|nr:ABC transporter ATP-binding protein [Homoserinimonas sp. OAct 916]
MSIDTQANVGTASAATADQRKPMLEVRDLQVGFTTQDKGIVPAVRGVNFTLNAGETLAIVGESGSGKSTTAHAIINLLPGTGKITGGSVFFDGEEISAMNARQIEDVRGRLIGFVPQDPMSNLNPVWNIGFQVEETLRANGLADSKTDARQKAIKVLQEAGLSDAASRLKQYPHQFSGGMRQRVLIGIGLSSQPKLLIADEPTSALDVTVQKVILDHLAMLTRETGTSVLFITHDLGLAAERAEKLVVMYQGKIVESGRSKDILADPVHPYTRRLVAAAPSLASKRMQIQKVEDADATELTDALDVTMIERAEQREERAKSGRGYITVSDVSKTYTIRRGGFKADLFTAVDKVSFQIDKGTTMGIVGESGSGKSTLAKLMLKLEPLSGGAISVDGKDIDSIKGAKELLAFRRKVQPVFQDPYGTLDPMYNIANTIAEPLNTHKIGTSKQRRARVRELLDQVLMPQSTMNRYPGELSGGQRQRIAIARALALKPEILVLDEAVSALDVLVQGQVLNLLTELQQELGLTYMFITHDLAVVRLVADRVCVMQKGRIVETATTDEVFDNPKELYTQELLSAIPGAGFEFGR